MHRMFVVRGDKRYLGLIGRVKTQTFTILNYE